MDGACDCAARLREQTTTPWAYRGDVQAHRCRLGLFHEREKQATHHIWWQIILHIKPNKFLEALQIDVLAEDQR